jgi:uncharacterized membrane protein
MAAKDQPLQQNEPPEAALSIERNDRIMASAAYLATFTGFWLIAPAIFYVLRGRRSRFVAFHAVQSLLLQVALLPLMFGSWGIALAIVELARGREGTAASPIVTVIALPIVSILLVFAPAVVMWMGMSALRGRARTLPLLGRWAHRVVGDSL